jgi:hypothetical protein
LRTIRGQDLANLYVVGIVVVHATAYNQVAGPEDRLVIIILFLRMGGDGGCEDARRDHNECFRQRTTRGVTSRKYSVHA